MPGNLAFRRQDYYYIILVSATGRQFINKGPVPDGVFPPLHPEQNVSIIECLNEFEFGISGVADARVGLQ
jgi:hypothetical protein